jgi:hypothetical protein
MWDVHVGEHAPVKWKDIPETSGIELVATDDRLCASLENADDAAFDTAVGAMLLDADDDAIAMQRFLYIRGGDVDVALRPLDGPLWRHERES